MRFKQRLEVDKGEAKQMQEKSFQAEKEKGPEVGRPARQSGSVCNVSKERDTGNEVRELMGSQILWGCVATVRTLASPLSWEPC